MIWPGVLGSALGVLNAIWNIWRWRVERTYVAWSFQLERAQPTGRLTAITITNSGDATAHDVRLGLATITQGPDADLTECIDAWQAHVYKQDSYTFIDPGLMADRPVRAVRMTWRNKPGKRLRSEIYDPYGGHSITPTARERLGAKIAGKPKTR